MALLASALLVTPAFMLFSTLAKDAADISQPLSSTNVLGSKERPISKVVRMLKDVEEELETSQDDDTAAHDKHVCLCDTNRKETTAAIEQGETNDAQLQAFIGEALAIIQELQVTRKDARDELYADQKSLDEAKAMRLKEHKDFNADAIFLNEAIDAAGQAIVVIGVHHPELAQVGSVMTKLQKANLMQSLPSSMVLRKDQLQVLKEFLQQPAGSSAFLVIPDFNSYSPQSGQIFGILTQRDADFENSLSDAEQNEKTSRTPLSTSLLVEAQQEKSLVTSADFSSVSDIPAMEASLGDVVTPGKFKEASRRHMKDHSTPTKELYNFTAATTAASHWRRRMRRKVVRLEKHVEELKDQVVTLALTVDVALATNVPQPSHTPNPSHKLKGKPIGKGFNEFMAFFKQAHPGSVYGKAASQVSKLVGEAWQAMNEVQKQPYREQFEQKLQSWATGQASNSSNCN